MIRGGEIVLTDPVHVPRPSGAVARRLAGLPEDRDLPFVRLALQMTLVLPPCAAYLFATPGFP